jgi:hypothetical protein
MPVTAPIMKVENCKKMGAKVVIYGSNFGEAKKRALQIGHNKKMLYVNGSAKNTQHKFPLNSDIYRNLLYNDHYFVLKKMLFCI